MFWLDMRDVWEAFPRLDPTINGLAISRFSTAQVTWASILEGVDQKTRDRSRSFGGTFAEA